MNWSSTFMSAAELVGTAAFAASGAMAGVERRLDVFGVCFLAVVTALGGGTIRDILLGEFPPRMFYSFAYLGLATLVALLVFILRGRLLPDPTERQQLWINGWFNLCDAIGLGIFSVVGTNACFAAGYGKNAFLAVFLGMTTGVGGGILRDMMCGEIPGVLRKHIYAVAAILGSLSYYFLRWLLHVGGGLATLLSVAMVVVLRMLAAHYRWNLPRPKE